MYKQWKERKPENSKENPRKKKTSFSHSYSGFYDKDIELWEISTKVYDSHVVDQCFFGVKTKYMDYYIKPEQKILFSIFKIIHQA